MEIKKDMIVFCMIGVVNWDFEVFECFDVFYIYWEDFGIKSVFSGVVRYFVFGFGIYNCVGVVFVKIEIEIVVNIVLDKMWNIRLEEGFCYVEFGLYICGFVLFYVVFDRV